jgi:hypothetical protein
VSVRLPARSAQITKFLEIPGQHIPRLGRQGVVFDDVFHIVDGLIELVLVEAAFAQFAVELRKVLLRGVNRSACRRFFCTRLTRSRALP